MRGMKLNEQLDLRGKGQGKEVSVACDIGASGAWFRSSCLFPRGSFNFKVSGLGALLRNAIDTVPFSKLRLCVNSYLSLIFDADRAQITIRGGVKRK